MVVRRPLVYRAIDTLAAMELVRAAGTVASTSGPQRTVLQATAGGKRAVTRWLRQPVEHVRDARSLLMLKLLFLTRREADLAPLLTAQRERFATLASRLAAAAEAAEDFDRAGAVATREHDRGRPLRRGDAGRAGPLALMPPPALLLVVFGGLPGTGKTTVARAVAARLRGAFVRIDEVEAAMWRAAIGRRRIERRRADVDGLDVPTWEQVISREYEPWSEDRLVLDTSRPYIDCVAAVEAYLAP